MLDKTWLAIPRTTRTEFDFAPPNRIDCYIKVVASSIQSTAMPWAWCVYAYIKPQHPLFGDAPALRRLPLHKGCTLLQTETTSSRGEYEDARSNEYTMWVVGANYQHAGDGFMFNNPAGGVPYEILMDVDSLMRVLVMRPKGGAT